MSAFALTIVALASISGVWSADIKSSESFSILAATPANADETKKAPRWAASATGRIEPVSGEIKLLPEVSGQIKDVIAITNDNVVKGDLLVVLDEGDLAERLRSAQAEVDVRKREREEEPPKCLAKDRQDAEDDVASARLELFAAWKNFDKAYVTYKKNSGFAYSVTSARDTINRIEKKLKSARAKLKKLNADPDMPFMTRLESSLAQSRADLAMVEHAYLKRRVRAPFDGTVLNVIANAGDMASPNSRQPLLVFGDISKLRVRAEVEERDVARVRIGQKVIVRADGFPGREFTGQVTQIASALGAPRIATRGPRRPNDVDVLEVVAELDGKPPLLTGMRVDVFFKRLEGDAKN